MGRAHIPHAAPEEDGASPEGRPAGTQRHLVRAQNGLPVGGPSVAIRKPDDVLAKTENLE